jgi:hypothetical protein
VVESGKRQNLSSPLRSMIPMIQLNGSVFISFLSYSSADGKQIAANYASLGADPSKGFILGGVYVPSFPFRPCLDKRSTAPQAQLQCSSSPTSSATNPSTHLSPVSSSPSRQRVSYPLSLPISPLNVPLGNNAPMPLSSTPLPPTSSPPTTRQTLLLPYAHRCSSLLTKTCLLPILPSGAWILGAIRACCMRRR